MQIRPFALERYFAEHEFTAELLLCSSDVEPYAMGELLALADDESRTLWDGLTLGYTETPGHPLLRAEIAALYPGLEPDDVLVFAGAQEAIFCFAQAALGAGDHAIVVTPAYQSLHEIARAAGAEVSLVELEHERGWTLDLDELGRFVRPDTRAIVVNFPHNPTGAHIDRATLEALVVIAEDSGAHLLSDEVYRWLEHAPADPLPGAAELSARAVSLGVMSKTFALPGLRIGWLASRDRELLASIAEIKDYTTICNSAPSEILALVALRRRDEVVARSRAIVDANLALLDDFFARSDAFEWARPRGAAIGFPRLAADVAIDDFARELVDEEGVLILPGSVYGHAGNHVRLGFGRRNMPEALARLERFAAARL
jgi:aspartate/methionine/tyrosine aminotransferase